VIEQYSSEEESGNKVIISTVEIICPSVYVTSLDNCQEQKSEKA
jgi:hypothetical protein